ncbi:MAG: esterase family protein [Porphyrobacter sp.]|jgi:pimeloyl-ACP methyl ester carboxylesterase|nr:esterase family protein [Porphyrobacter sp.]
MRLTLRRPRRAIALGILAVLLACGYWGWRTLTTPQGAQTVAFTPALEACASDGPMKYCIYRARSGTNGDVVYHLHGRNLDARVWNDATYYTGLLQAEWQARGVRPPTVVTLSYGGSWLLSPKGAAPDSGLLDDMMERIPAIEKKLGTPRRRILLGESMGGLNVLVAGLAYPEHFARIAALCPGVYTVSPFSPISEIRAGLARTGADPKIAFGIWMLARRHYSNDREWRVASPLTLIEQAGPQSPALYLSNGLYDAYGNFEGTQALARRARARGVQTEWHPLYGGHCALDAPSVAAFLVS